MIQLTEEQKAIVEFSGAPMRLLAGPGTGKTLCIIEKTKYLIEKRRISHKEICAITFTKAAARELWERLVKTGIKQGSLPYVNTLHGLAMGILRSHLKRAGMKPGFKLVEGFTQNILIKDVLQDLRERNIKLLQSDIKLYLKAHSQVKSKAGLPSHISSNSHKQRILDEFSKSFHENLCFYNALDWADILHRSIELLDQYNDIRKETHEKTQYLLVDEYQDLNPLEQYFIDKIIGNINGLCVVGDDDQSIYETFRFADPQGIINFPNKYKDAKSFFITLCRRCPPEVIEHALRLIKNNKKRVAKALFPFDKHKKGFVVCVSHRSKKKEAEWLTSKVIELVKKGINYKDILILFTDGDIAKYYVAALKEEELPLDVQLKVSNIFNSPYFIWLLATIRWMVDNEDNLSMRQCLDYWKGIGPETVRQLRFIALSSNDTLWLAIDKVASNLDVFKQIKLRKAVKAFHDYMNKLKNFKKFTDITDLFLSIRPESREDLGCSIFLQHLHTFKNQEEVVNLKEILESFEEGIESGELESLYKKKHDNIRIMSFHSAKGCESEVVIIPALEDDIMPGISDNMEEQRRLFYVSITRAKYVVFLSWARQRTGQEIYKKEGRKMLGKYKSRFLSEIGK